MAGSGSRGGRGTFKNKINLSSVFCGLEFVLPTRKYVPEIFFIVGHSQMLILEETDLGGEYFMCSLPVFANEILAPSSCGF